MSKNIKIYFTSRIISYFGTLIQNFAFGLYVLEKTSSPMSLATVLILGAIPEIILGMFGGIIADRYNKKKILIIGDLIRVFVLSVVVTIIFLNDIQIRMIYFIVIFLSIINIFFCIDNIRNINNFYI
jgi:MFS family permease